MRGLYRHSFVAQRWFARWSTFAVVAFFGYSIFLAISNAGDGSMTFEEASFGERILGLVGVVAALTTWISAAMHAFGMHRRGWAFAVFICWPAAFYYMWRFHEWDSDSSAVTIMRTE